VKGRILSVNVMTRFNCLIFTSIGLNAANAAVLAAVILGYQKKTKDEKENMVRYRSIKGIGAHSGKKIIK
jgi:hypothetical protein